VVEHSGAKIEKRKQGKQDVDLLERAFATGDKASSLRFYRFVRRIVRGVLFPYFDLAVTNEHYLNLPGPAIVAPVHRSHLDSPLVASLSERRQRAIGKESLFKPPVVRWVCAALGAIPVRRGEADRDALKAARVLLDRGESMFVTGEAMGEGARFPKRTRVGIAVGEPMAAPVGADGKRVGREQLRAFTSELGERLQQLQDDARALAQGEPT